MLVLWLFSSSRHQTPPHLGISATLCSTALLHRDSMLTWRLWWRRTHEPCRHSPPASVPCLLDCRLSAQPDSQRVPPRPPASQSWRQAANNTVVNIPYLHTVATVRVSAVAALRVIVRTVVGRPLTVTTYRQQPPHRFCGRRSPQRPFTATDSAVCKRHGSCPPAAHHRLVIVSSDGSSCGDCDNATERQ